MEDIILVSCGGEIRTQWLNPRGWPLNHYKVLLQNGNKKPCFTEVV